MTYSGDDQLPPLSEEGFLELRATVQPYTVCILRKGPAFEIPGPDFTQGVTRIIYEHGKRNVRLRQAGLMPIICPISDEGEFAGIGIFDCPVEDAHRIMSLDPAIQANVLTFELHQSRSFPASTLPTHTVVSPKRRRRSE